VVVSRASNGWGGEGALADTTQAAVSAGDDPSGPADPSAAEIDAAVAFSPLLARADVVVAAIIALIAATLTVAMPMLIASGGIDTERDFATLSPALIPRLAFGCLTVLAIVALIPAVETMRSGVGQPRPEELGRLQRAGIAIAITVAYALCVPWLGYILATMVMTAAMAWYLGLRNPLAFIPGVIVIPILIRFVFERLLLISLPRSSIESIGLIEDAVLRYLTHMVLS
jgi:hypothetical protein